MRAISLWQPWASAIANGVKTIETRHWPTAYSGYLAIHAAKKYNRELRGVFHDLVLDYGQFARAFDAPFDELPFGAIVAVATLKDCVPVESVPAAKLSPLECALGNYSAGRYAWILIEIQKLRDPVPCSGRQNFFALDGCIAEQVRKQL